MLLPNVSGDWYAWLMLADHAANTVALILLLVFEIIRRLER